MAQVFVSPGVYTSERDLTFVTRQIGVTTLGLVGETTIGPAFQPIFISNYGEFQSFFGGLNATKVKDNGYPQYELPYIAKSYLSEANQLFVTRVLGFSGFDAGLSWALTLDGALDVSTTATTITATSRNPHISFTATSAGTNVTLVASDSLTQSLINDGSLTGALAFLGASSTGDTGTVDATYLKTGSSFSGVSFNIYVNAVGTSGSYITGTTTGVTVNYSGTSYADAENKVVALLRSRGTVDSISQLTNFEVTGSTGVVFNSAYTAATTNPLGIFALSGYSER